MTTIKQLIILAVRELGLTGEDPDTNMNTAECILLESLSRRVIGNLNMNKLYARRTAKVTMNGNTYDLDDVPYLVLGVERVLINGNRYPHTVDGHVLTVDTSNTDATIELVYVGCPKVPASVTADLSMPTFITDNLLVSGICLEYCKAKGVEYAVGYYEQAYTEGLRNAFSERRNIIIERRRFL